jgi:hypothetical protein
MCSETTGETSFAKAEGCGDATQSRFGTTVRAARNNVPVHPPRFARLEMEPVSAAKAWCFPLNNDGVFARSIAHWIAAGGRLFSVLYFDLLLSKSFVWIYLPVSPLE